MHDNGKLLRLFHSGFHHAALAPGISMESGLRRKIRVARSTWPTIDLSDEVFVPYLAQRAKTDLSELFTSDLYLACACSQQNPEAIRLFEREFLRDLHAKLAQLGGTDAFAEDVRQTLMQSLFLPDPSGRLRISSYSGAGPLRTWVYAIAMRKAMRLHLKAQREAGGQGEDLFQAIALMGDLELELIQSRQHEQFKSAVSQAVRKLSSRDRNVLRLHHLAGMTLDQVASMYRVHRATVARWLAVSRTTILEETRQSLQAHLRLNRSEVDSFLRVMRSQVEASLVRLLQSSQDTGRWSSRGGLPS